jgi:type I restriction enzyme M protein
VGVVIEEDGKTEEEFLATIAEQQAELAILTDAAHELEETLSKNIDVILGEE